jgi:hypothetical protein
VTFAISKHLSPRQDMFNFQLWRAWHFGQSTAGTMLF